MVDDRKPNELREEKAGWAHAPSAVGGTAMDVGGGQGMIRCRDRLEVLRGLKAGWYEGQGHPIGPTALKAAETLLMARPSFAEAYRLYPTEEGGVLIEFETRGWDLSVEIDVSGAIQIYGVEIAGAGELSPRSFDGMSEQFLNLFDERAVH